MTAPCNHDMRFKGVYGARLGCLACELEHTEKERKRLEEELEKAIETIADMRMDLALGGTWTRGQEENDS